MGFFLGVCGFILNPSHWGSFIGLAFRPLEQKIWRTWRVVPTFGEFLFQLRDNNSPNLGTIITKPRDNNYPNLDKIALKKTW